MSTKINPLSTAKGQKYECEMCGKPALLACKHCRVTFYCGHEHQSVDWYGIHDKICQLLGALRTLHPTLGSEEERERRALTIQMSQHALIDLCRNEAQKHMVAENHELAVPAALQSLRFSIKVYGNARIELVPAYLLVAEVNLGLKRYKMAEEFLLYANWSALKSSSCGNELRSQLYRNFGRLYAAQGKYEDALRQLAQDVYFSSLESGPEHIDTAGGYYALADVFLLKDSVEHSLALYDKVVDIWYKFLMKLRSRSSEHITDYLSEANITKSTEMLRKILLVRQKYLGQNHIATGESSFAIGTLMHLNDELDEAEDYYEHALRVYESELGAEHESTLAIRSAMGELVAVKLAREDQSDDAIDDTIIDDTIDDAIDGVDA